LIGTNPKSEAPVLNARIRKAWSRGATIGLIGEPVDLTYDYVHVGTGRADLQGLLKKDHKAVLEQPSVVVLGQAALQGEDGAAVLAATMELCEKTASKLMILHTAAARVGAMDLGCTTDGGLTAALDGAEVIYNMGADELDIAPGAFVIYQGSHGDRGAHRADIILPGAAYTEENSIFVNTEGRPQLAQRAGFAPGDAKENWAILRALSAELGAALPYDTLAQLRKHMIAAAPHLAALDMVPENEWQAVSGGKMGQGDFGQAISDYYLSNPIARASALMAELSANAKARKSAPLAAE